jgi:hypothetical protein
MRLFEKLASKLSLTRPGYPPGHRKKHIHLVDRILSDFCYSAREAPDTSWGRGLPDRGSNGVCTQTAAV